MVHKRDAMIHVKVTEMFGSPPTFSLAVFGSLASIILSCLAML